MKKYFMENFIFCAVEIILGFYLIFLGVTFRHV